MNIERSVELLNFALDKVHEAAFLIDKDARFRYVNDESCRALGYSREELLGLGIADIDPDFHIERWPVHWDELRKRGSITFEGRHRTKDGRIFPVEISDSYFEYDGQGYNLGLVRDITERKRVEDTLRFIAQRGWAGTADSFLSALAGYLADTLGMDYVLIANLLDDGYGVAETSALYAKGEILPNIRYELKGTPCENVIGKKLCLYPEGIQALFPADSLLADMGAESYAGIPLWDSAGRPIGLLAALDGKPFHDESTLSYILQLAATSAAAALERERDDRLLAAREREFRTLAENSPDCILRYDNGCRCIYANPRIENTLGIPAGGMLGKTPMELFPDGEYRGYQDRIEEVLGSGADAELDLVLPDTCEGVRHHHVRFTAERGHEGAITGVMVIGRDITERKHLENALRESEEHFRTSTEKSPIGVYIIQDDLFRYVNPAFAAMHGYTPEEIIDRLGPDDFIMPDDRERLLAGIRSEFEFYHDVFHISRKDSSILVIEVFGSRALYRGRPAIIGSVIDVTERKKSEEQLFQVTERWKRTFDAVPDLIAIIDTDFRVVQVNKAMADRLGAAAPTEYIGQVCYEAIHKTEGPPSYCPHLQTLQDCLEHRAEVSEESLGGDFIVSTSPIYDSAGLLMGSVHVARDITERKKAETALKESERRISESLEFNNCVINTSPIGILTFNADGQCTFANESAAEIVGTKVSSLLRQNFHELESWKNSGMYHAACQALNEGGKKVEDVLHVVSTFGRHFWVNASFDTFHFGGERSLLLCMQDITERKRAEIKLNEQLHFLQQLLDSIPIPVYYKDVNTVYLGCNSAFEEFIGLSRNLIVGKTVYDVAPKELADIYHETDAALFRNPGEQMYEASVIYNDGECHNVIFNKATFVDPNNCVAGIVGAMIDITERVKSEEERKMLEAQLHQSQKMEAVGQLAGGIAHDFNNILTAILGYTSMILVRMEKDSPLRRNVEQVLAAAKRAAELTKGLLAFSRRQVLNAKSIDLCEVMRGLEKMLERLVPEDIDFRTTVVEGDLVVMADKVQIEQALMNLVTNAKDAMPRGGTLTIEVSPAVMDEQFVHAHGFGEPGDYACITVSDTGHGMDGETRKRIFEPFFTTKEVGKGTGLGMAIIYGIIRQHKGYISFYSEKEMGTTFKIYLPLIAEGIKEVHDTRETEPPPGGTETVLLAEDDAAVLELHRMILEEAGYRVIEAVDGRDALDKFTEHRTEVDILATDVIMPKMNGKSLYDEIRKVRPDMKVLFMSGYTKDIIVKRGIMDDEFSLLTKPVTSHELLKRMREILDWNRHQ